MKQKIKYIITGMIIVIIALTSKAQAKTATVLTETLNLRSKASTDSNIIELLSEKEKLEILSEEGDWYKVKHNEKEGYVNKNYVKISSDSEEQKTDTTENEDKTVDQANDETNQEAQNTSVENENIKLEKDTKIRILPLINSIVIDTIKAGEEVAVVAKANNWTFIQTNEISGWIVSDPNLGKATTQEENNDQKAEESNSDEKDKEEEPATETNSTGKEYSESVKKYINVTSAYVREKPSTDSNIVTTLIKNTDVTVTGEDGDWYKVKYGDYAGYIYKNLLSENKTEETNRSGNNIRRIEAKATNTSSLGTQIAEYAQQYLGCPYVYGASGSSSFDCSGFTMYVYKHFGYSLNHSARSQSNEGVYVEKGNLQPGDLVFFLDYPSMDGIGHCGIYIGDGNFIHASSGSGYCVKISTLLSGSYLNRYATARRLI